LHHAWKVYHYRRDVIDAAVLDKLEKSATELQDTIADKESTDKQLSAHKDTLEKALLKCGGRLYPVTFLSENVEVILVAAILAIGIRSFFFQPFKIPTNSMWPTYAGVNEVIFENPDDVPSGINKAFRKLRYWASQYEYRATTDGELLIPVDIKYQSPDGQYLNFNLRYEPVVTKKLFFFKAHTKRYTFHIGDKDKVLVDIPGEFDINELLYKTLSPDSGNPRKYFSSLNKTRTIGGVSYLSTGKHFKKGDVIFGFEIQTGDMLFVNRFSYHFWPPEVGDPFVFMTTDQKGVKRTTYISTAQGSKYFIKRLVGLEGDKLHVANRKLYRNGELITGTPVFAKNNEQEESYNGYIAIIDKLPVDNGKIRYGNPVPKNHYIAMGDNSENSHDSRVWGYVRDQSVVGKAAFVFYPFSSRWGFAD